MLEQSGPNRKWQVHEKLGMIIQLHILHKQIID